jgi:hypothetical protein
VGRNTEAVVAGEGADAAADRLDGLGDLLGGPRGGALEQHPGSQFRNAVVGRRLGEHAAFQDDPDVNGRNLRVFAHEHAGRDAAVRRHELAGPVAAADVLAQGTDGGRGDDEEEGDGDAYVPVLRRTVSSAPESSRSAASSSSSFKTRGGGSGGRGDDAPRTRGRGGGRS